MHLLFQEWVPSCLNSYIQKFQEKVHNNSDEDRWAELEPKCELERAMQLFG